MASTVTQQGGNIVANSTINFATYCYLDGQVAIFDLKYLVNSVSGGSPTMGAMAKAMWDVFSPALQDITTTETQLIGAKLSQVRPVPPATTNPLSGIVEDTIMGSVTGETCPKQASVVCTTETIVAGPGGRGRMYLPFIPVSSMAANGEIGASYITNAATLCSLMRTTGTFAPTGGTVSLQTVLYKRSNNTITNISDIRVNNRIGTQKRRGDYGRLNGNII